MRRVGAVALGLLLSLSACAGLRVTEPDELRSAAPEARRGGRLVVAVTAPSSVDPALADDDAGRLIASLVCEPLVQLDPVTGKVARGIVDTITVTGQGAGMTVSLRKNVSFHNGKRLTAQDVRYALSRVVRHDVASPVASVLLPLAGAAGLRAAPPPTDETKPEDRRLAGVSAISKHALEIGLLERNAEFVRALSTIAAAPVPEELPDRDEGFSDRPVCAGPYEMTRPYTRGDPSIELRRFEDYYGRNEGHVSGGVGYPDVVEFRIVADRAAQVRAFEAGEVDIALVPPGDAAALRASHGRSFLTTPLPQLDYLVVPSGFGPEVRAALGAALDRGLLVDEVFGGGRLPATRILPPAAGVEEDDCAAGTADERHAGAVEPLRTARQKLYVNDDFANKAMAEGVARQWRENLGLDVEVVAMPWDEYLAKATSPEGFDGFFRASWAPPAPGPDGYLFSLFHTDAIGTTNLSRFGARDVDRRLERVARREGSEELRLAKYASVEELVCREAPVIPLTFGQEEWLVRTDRLAPASGSWFHRSTGQPLLRELYVKADR